MIGGGIKSTTVGGGPFGLPMDLCIAAGLAGAALLAHHFHHNVIAGGLLVGAFVYVAHNRGLLVVEKGDTLT